MSSKWFSNRGQVIQTTAAIISSCVALVALYFVLKSNNSLPNARTVMYIAGATSLLLVGILIGRRSKLAPPSANSATLQSDTPTIENAANGGTTTAPPNAINADKWCIPAAVPLVVDERPRPNLICTSFKNVSVQRSIGDVWNENYADGAVPAAIAVITNRATEKNLASARDVKAQMIFYDSKGTECLHGTGAWLGHFRNAAGFSLGGSQKLLLVLDNNPENVVAVSNTNEQPLPDSARGRIRALEASVATFDVLTLPVVCDVTLLSNSGTVFAHFAVEIRREADRLVLASATPR